MYECCEAFNVVLKLFAINRDSFGRFRKTGEQLSNLFSLSSGTIEFAPPPIDWQHLHPIGTVLVVYSTYRRRWLPLGYVKKLARWCLSAVLNRVFSSDSIGSFRVCTQNYIGSYSMGPNVGFYISA